MPPRKADRAALVERTFAIMEGDLRGIPLTATDIGMVALGYGKFVRARDIIALLPIDDAHRGDGRRTYVHVAGIPGPIVASRSERAILADMQIAAGAGQTTASAHAEDAEAPAGVRGPGRWRGSRRRRAGRALVAD
jgi:hypothetical protein